MFGQWAVYVLFIKLIVQNGVKYGIKGMDEVSDEGRDIDAGQWCWKLDVACWNATAHDPLNFY